MTEIAATPRTQVRRLPQRAVYDREVVHAILDEGFICHVGFAVDGQPYVIPTGYGRAGDTLYLHGSAASRMLRSLKGGIDVCVTVTLLDGLVLAKSAFHHSMNYRSVVVLGEPRAVEDPDEKMAAAEALTDRLMPGRWADIRWPSRKELRATTFLALTLTEASAKVREGAPVDDAEDYALDAWAGVVPLRLTRGEPEPDPRLREGIAVPASVEAWSGRAIA